MARLQRILAEAAPADAPPAVRDSVAGRQAGAAAALLRLGESAVVWPRLRHSPDPTTRTYLIHELGRAADPAVIVGRLHRETDISARRALVLILGQAAERELSPAQRESAVATLLGWYRDDPDPGIHGAIDWLLRPQRRGDQLRSGGWARAGELERIDRELAGRRRGSRNWFVTSEGHTLAVVRAPVQFRMGSPENETGRVAASDAPEEPLHDVRIPRSFAIGTKEVTVAQFRRFLDANPEVKARHAYANDSARMVRMMATFSPDPDGPQIAVTWYEAAAYCNWLSKQDGIPESEWVYPADPADIKAGMELPRDYLRRTGYRLPTEAEWEFAARAGSTTARFFGATDTHLRAYAWHASNPPKQKGDPVDPRDPQRTWPVGQLMPNDLGLFDVYGNVWEWTQNRMELRLIPGDVREDVEDSDRVVRDTTARPRRGGAFPYEGAHARSAPRGTTGSHPTTRRDNVGFRIARTMR